MALGRARKERPPRPEGGIITALKPKGSDGSRVSVHLEGAHAFTLSAAIAARTGLQKDQFLSDEDLAALLQEDEPERAREAALEMLGHREMCAAEVAGKLGSLGISERTVAETIVWLQQRDYVDDRRFAAAYAASKLKAGWGRQRIALELVRKGVSRELVTGEAWQDLVELPGGLEGLQQTVDLVRRRFAGQLRSDPQGARRRINGFLARRGHDWETISAILRAVEEEDSGGDSEEWQRP